MKLILIILSLFFSKQKHHDYAYHTSAKVDGIFYKAIVNNDQSVSIVLQSGKTAFHIDNKGRDFEGIETLEFLDFNGDGYKDLMIKYLSNVPERCDLFLYDKKTKQFVKIKNFREYPDPKRIPKTTCYYSYHRSGCADMDWDSDLFKIVDFKIVKIGNIAGRTCDDIDNGIFIYRLSNHKKTLVKKFTINVINSYNDTKWGFIAGYWKNNYQKFPKAI